MAPLIPSLAETGAIPLITFEDRTVLFVHIPKTGGSSLGHWLSEWGTVSFQAKTRPRTYAAPPQHFTYADMLFLFNGPAWDYAFAVVRNPYDRIESEYFFRNGNAPGGDRALPDFTEWVQRHLAVARRNPFHLDSHLRPQVDFLEDSVDVLTFESGMEDIVRHLGGKLGVAPADAVPRRNARPAAATAQWTAQARQEVNNFYRDDFAALGYDRL